MIVAGASERGFHLRDDACCSEWIVLIRVLALSNLVPLCPSLLIRGRLSRQSLIPNKQIRQQSSVIIRVGWHPGALLATWHDT